jgi:hypothetical protein
MDRRLANLCGGHVRNLFILMRSALDYCDDLPITNEIITLTVRQEADSISLPLGNSQWALLREVHTKKRSMEDAGEAWYDLLKDLYVFAYRDDLDLSPILRQTVKTQISLKSLNGELSHGIVSQAVH